MTTIDQQFVEYIVKSLVNRPEAVIVERRIDEKGVLLELTVDPEDLGRVIGKRGATAQSIRTLLRALGTKNDARYNLKIVDNDDHGDRSFASSTSDDAQSDQPVVAASTDDSGKPVDDVTDKPVDEDDDNEDSMVKRTRKELAELDDLRL